MESVEPTRADDVAAGERSGAEDDEWTSAEFAWLDRLEADVHDLAAELGTVRSQVEDVVAAVTRNANLLARLTALS
jgi:hypothetical protein